MAQIATAWVLSNPLVTAPIIGVSFPPAAYSRSLADISSHQSTRVEAIHEAAAATHIELTEDEIKAISEPYRPRGILGHQ